MSNLSVIKHHTMSTVEISQLLGKEKSHLHRDIRVQLIEGLYGIKDDPNLDRTDLQGISIIKRDNGQIFEILLNRYHTDILISGYEVKYRAAIVKRWHELEENQNDIIRQRLAEATYENECLIDTIRLLRSLPSPNRTSHQNDVARIVYAVTKVLAKSTDPFFCKEVVCEDKLFDELVFLGEMAFDQQGRLPKVLRNCGYTRLSSSTIAKTRHKIWVKGSISLYKACEIIELRLKQI